ncbi:ABC transporter permease [Halalkaliarchaeum desulfuricum]|uniref:ABC transporter permease n=1 Tax=Halalkaliarchaeum desulfuricum TaxID=2055893 RepID=A0A343TK26_9EURY|nr:ABC transporter permease [Halalkaliarchaeum desulfuricum]AUX09448.1 ABC transporter permease [Halalkaliarchaeum desulfuricum]
MDVELVVGVVVLGVLHGVLPDHGWPIAAAYALDRPRKWIQGTIAGLVLGIGHLISSVALVVAYFSVSRFAEFAEGPYMKPLAGTMLILLGVHEYLSDGHGDHDHNHEHDHDHDHNHEHDHDHNHDHDHDHDQDEPGPLARIRDRLPGGNGGHAHLDESHAEGGLATLGTTALVLGFAHEEPLQILAICAGTEFCLELMLVYSGAVILAILAPTLLLIAGYQTHRERIEQYTPYLPTLTAVVLVLVGFAFVFGVF